jgi:hypothetical protein
MSIICSFIFQHFSPQSRKERRGRKEIMPSPLGGLIARCRHSKRDHQFIVPYYRWFQGNNPAVIAAEDFHFLSSQQKMKKYKLSASFAPLR